MRDINRFTNILQVLVNKYQDQEIWKEVNETLEEIGGNVDKKDFYNPFKHIIIGILAQNTSDRNCVLAYSGLKKAIGDINPENLANANEDFVKEAIRSGGLYNVKAKRIIEVSNYILKTYNGDISSILKESTEEALKQLLKIKGIGIKTAEVFLVYIGKRKLFPIDTNIKRVLWRIGITNQKNKYIIIQEKVKKNLEEDKFQLAHELLIRLGRDYCKAPKPKCSDCPINELCEKNIEPPKKKRKNSK
ncbi:hypothetical protein LCGC14_1197970 [marine sediment metagenome]|uniref:HhH-GPD domain-containing protein n=1 Tax=marine sediment metagenome TaxID=412755 RepID=A0A0F9M529_9ZZZZ